MYIKVRGILNSLKGRRKTLEIRGNIYFFYFLGSYNKISIIRKMNVENFK